MAVAALHRLRASERLCDYVAALTRHHLRLGFLVHEVPLSRRAIYRYLKACAPVQVDVTVLSVADRLATRGTGSDEAIAKHLELARAADGRGARLAAETTEAPGARATSSPGARRRDRPGAGAERRSRGISRRATGELLATRRAASLTDRLRG